MNWFRRIWINLSSPFGECADCGEPLSRKRDFTQWPVACPACGSTTHYLSRIIEWDRRGMHGFNEYLRFTEAADRIGYRYRKRACK